MRRKIIPHGPSSMTISLPASWVKQHNLKKGEELEVLEEDNDLTIKAVCARSETKKIEISFVDLDIDTEQDLLITLHKKGYDEIIIHFDKPNTIKEIHSFLSNTQLGFEIIKQDQNFVTIRNISNPESEQLDALFRRIFRIMIEYAKKIEHVIKEKEDATNSCLLHETSICRISNYCKRIIIKEKRQNSSFLYLITNNITNIAHTLSSLLTEFDTKKIKPTEQFKTKFSETNEVLVQIYELNYKFSLKDYSLLKKRLELLKKQILKNSKETKEPWNYLIEINRDASKLLEEILSLQF